MYSLKIAIFTRHSNKTLYSVVSDCIKELPYDKIPITGTSADGYLIKILESDYDFVVNLDDDAFVTRPSAINEIIQHMIENDYDYCGVPDGGCIRIRKHNPCSMNPFFNIFNVKSIREKVDNFKVGWYEGLKEKAPLHKLVEGNIYKFDNFEVYYPVFFALLEKCKPLYLDSIEHPDGVSNIVLFNDRQFLIHTWYARLYPKYKEHKTRIDKIISSLKKKKILITCPPMINRINEYQNLFEENNMQIYCPQFEQVLTEEELVGLLPEYDGWIIGDDPATRKVVEAGLKGKFRAAVKWGVGVDNVEFDAFKDNDIPVTNTPGMFNDEVSDVAVGYLICLARHLVDIHENVKKGNWYKPAGMSLRGKKVGLLGYGNIGKSIAKKMTSLGLKVVAYDPYCGEELSSFEETLRDADFIVIACALTESSKYCINSGTIRLAKKGVYIINVARGKIIKEEDLIKELASGYVAGAALEVFEEEPLPVNSKLKEYNCLFGSHNSSNTVEAVDRTSVNAISKLSCFLG